jgi:D-xylose transport system substrate-binding protein
VTVSFLLPDNVTARYEGQDKPAVIAALTKYIPNVKVDSYNALGDAARQQSQAEDALSNGSKVLIVIPVDSVAAASIVTLAHQDKVPVIAYTRVISNAPLDYFVGKDTKSIGVQEGQWMASQTKAGDNIAVLDGSPTDQNAKLYEQGYMSVLQPLFTSGERKLAGELWTANWDPNTAQTEMEQLLTKNNNNIQAVIGPNDGMAGGVVAALSTASLAGKVLVTGLDASLAGSQRILQGTQGMTVMQNIAMFGDETGKLAAMLVAGQTPPTDFFQGTTDNGMAKVPTVFVPTTVITKANMDLVITSGAFTKAQLCQGITPGTGPC